MPPPFIITVDTEGDNLWSRPREVTTRNTAFLPRLQQLAEHCGLRPTWLVNWEMAHDGACAGFLRDVLARDAGEVGMHLHAWDTPPLDPLTDDDLQHHPYLFEYSEGLQRAKLERLAGALEEKFQRPLRSHRAGRWGFGAFCARWLREHGFWADCSVCPGVDWSVTKGDPRGGGGPDFRNASAAPYFIDENDVAKSAANFGPDALLEVPMTIGASNWARALFASRRHAWLRPNGKNLEAMLARVDEAVSGGRAHLMFMIHSSELMPGGSPTFRDAASIERLYGDLEAVFSHAEASGCPGRTLGEFAGEWRTAAKKTG